MSNQQDDPNSFAAKIFQLQQHQKILAKLILEIKGRLDSLTEKFDNRPEIQQISTLEDAIAGLTQQADRLIFSEPQLEVVSLETEAVDLEEIQQQPLQIQSYEYQLVFDRSGSRAVLLEALSTAQERLIIVCPWLNRSSIDADIIQKFINCLNRNCSIEIGWGYLGDRAQIGVGWRYNALKDLRQLERDYPDLFKLKLLGTHEKFLVCDRVFAMLGSHNLLTSSAQSAEREAGILTTDPQIIQGLINRFDGAEVQDVQAIDRSLIVDAVSLVDVSDADENINDFAEDSQESAVSAEEFLKRYQAGESDFTGINLAGANLIEISLAASRSVNLSKANLKRANLAKAKLGANLSQANLSEANLIEANLSYANFSSADLRSAELSAAQLDYAKLVGTNLSSATLIQANLSRANLSEANLSNANLTGASLGSANLMNACLKGTNLAAANLSQSNLRRAEFNEKTRLCGADLNSTNLAGQNLQKLNLSGVNMSNANLCGTWLCFSDLSGANLSLADLRGADLSGANLEKANLEEANLSGANLNEAKLNGAIMPDGTTHE